ncbi:MAG: glycosyltransferase family 2 protein [Chloroflexota bacterium]|nr:MAG: glycosyltransferase family 2 protein [Chloroflexota bacterium]
MDLSIIVVSWNVAPLLANCLRSIAAGAQGLEYEVIVIDNASTDGTAEMVQREFPEARLTRNTENIGFARANNQGIRVSQGRYVLLLNCDTIVPLHGLSELVRFMNEHPDAGACGPRLVRSDGTPQPYCFGGDPTLRYLVARGLNQILFHRYLHDWGTDRIQRVDWVSGACLLLRQEALSLTGALDENIFMYFEDNDLCLRLRKQRWGVYLCPQVSVTHLGGQSLGQNPWAREEYYRSLDYFFAKHYAVTSRTLMRPALKVYRLLVGR